jgi:hypothetical protein
MIVAVALGEARPGYELWHPNREKPEVVTTKFVVTFLMLATAALSALIAISGWSLLSGGGSMGVVCLIYTAIYALFAFRAAQWSRGVLPVGAALSMILAIFCAVGANSWFSRDKTGFEDALLPVPLIGLLVLLLLVIQILLIVAASYGFSQAWNVEEERPIGSGEDYGAGAPPENGAPQPA